MISFRTIDRGRPLLELLAICRYCKKEYSIEVLRANLSKWQSGVFIQDALPELSIDQRELLISGCCGGCFDGVFNDDEEEA